MMDLEQISNCPESGASLGPHPQLSAGLISYLCFVASFNTRSDLSLSSRSKWYCITISTPNSVCPSLNSFPKLCPPSAFPICMGGTNIILVEPAGNLEVIGDMTRFDPPAAVSLAPLGGLLSSPLPHHCLGQGPLHYFSSGIQAHPPNCSSLASWPASSTLLLQGSFKNRKLSMDSLYVSGENSSSFARLSPEVYI